MLRRLLDWQDRILDIFWGVRGECTVCGERCKDRMCDDCTLDNLAW